VKSKKQWSGKFQTLDSMQYKLVKCNKCARLPDSGGGSLIVIPSSPLSPITFDGPKFWRSISVCSSLHLLTTAHCAWCAPSIPLWLASHLLAPAGGRTESPDCALHIPVSHDRRRAYLFFLLVHQAFGAWCKSRFQQLIRDYPPQN